MTCRNILMGMGALPELRAARQALYLKYLAELGSLTAAAKAAAIHVSLPAHWRRRYPTFAKAEQKARRQAAKHLLQKHASGSER
jgi:hypothetical protein